MIPETDKGNKPATQDEIKGRLIFGPLMIVIGIALLLFWSYPKIQKSKEINSWEQTEGKITEAIIVAHNDGNDCVLGRKNPEHHINDEGVKFRIEIEYNYQVDTLEYTSRKRDLFQQKDEGSSKYKRAIAQRDRYLNKNKVTVYYNPANPAEALLSKGLSFGQWILVVIPVFAPIIGILLLISALVHKLRVK